MATADALIVARGVGRSGNTELEGARKVREEKKRHTCCLRSLTRCSTCRVQSLKVKALGVLCMKRFLSCTSQKMYQNATNNTDKSTHCGCSNVQYEQLYRDNKITAYRTFILRFLKIVVLHCLLKCAVMLYHVIPKLRHETRK